METERIVKNIQRICKERGTTPTVACRESGAGKGMVSALKKQGTIPSIEKMSLLASYLGVTTSELLGEKKPTPDTESGLSAEQADLVSLYDAAPPALRAAALAVLRSAEGQGKAQGGASTTE